MILIRHGFVQSNDDIIKPVSVSRDSGELLLMASP